MPPKATIQTRWPHAEPCLPEPPTDPVTGEKIFRCRQSPGARWMFLKKPDGDGNWVWGCEYCGKVINDPRHFTTTEHMKQTRQRQIPALTESGQADGLPDPQLFVGGGDLWGLTGGRSTADIPRHAYAGWIWDWAHDQKNNPIDPCTYPDDWDHVPVNFPSTWDRPDYVTPQGVVASNAQHKSPWTQVATPDAQQQDLERRAAGARAASQSS